MVWKAPSSDALLQRLEQVDKARFAADRVAFGTQVLLPTEPNHDERIKALGIRSPRAGPLALAVQVPSPPSRSRNKASESKSPRSSSLAEGWKVPADTPRRIRKSTQDSLPSVSGTPSSRTRSHSSVDMEEVKQEELQAQNRVARLRAQLARAERLERELHVEEARKKKRDQVVAMRAEDELSLIHI